MTSSIVMRTVKSPKDNGKKKPHITKQNMTELQIQFTLDVIFW